MNVKVGVDVLVCVDVSVGVNVSVGEEVFVGVGVKAGPSNCPDPQDWRNKMDKIVRMIVV